MKASEGLTIRTRRKRSIKHPNRLTFGFIADSRFGLEEMQMAMYLEEVGDVGPAEIADRDLDFAKSFEYNECNQTVLALIQEHYSFEPQHSIAVNTHALATLNCSTIKVTLNGPIPEQGSFISLVQEFNPAQPFECEYSSALVGTRVPVKVSFQYLKGKRTKRRAAYILSLSDADSDGYLVYYLRRGSLVAERLLLRDFVLCPLGDEDKEAVRVIQTLLEEYQRPTKEEEEDEEV